MYRWAFLQWKYTGKNEIEFKSHKKESQEQTKRRVIKSTASAVKQGFVRFESNKTTDSYIFTSFLEDFI